MNNEDSFSLFEFVVIVLILTIIAMIFRGCTASTNQERMCYGIGIATGLATKVHKSDCEVFHKGNWISLQQYFDTLEGNP